MIRQDPEAAETVRQAALFQSALHKQLHWMNDETFTGADEANTVQVTINGHQTLIGLHIQNGLLKKFGAEGVEQRINEALLNASLTAAEALEAKGAGLEKAFAEISRVVEGLA